MKKISRQDSIGDAGVALIHLRVAAMGHIWHERKTDAGIDGEIELRNAQTGEVRNHIVLVQSKASDADFPGETDESFHFVVKERDLEYWLSGNAPVVLVCSHPKREQAWWVHINEYFADAARRESRKVVFDKVTQEFGASAAHPLARLAAPAGSGVYLGPEPRTETILSNLLPLVHPEKVFFVPSSASDNAQVRDALIATGVNRTNWTLRGGHLYSFQPFSEKAWDRLLDGPEMSQPTESYLRTDSGDEQRLGIELINRAVRDTFHRELRWHGRRKMLYFRGTADLSPRKVAGRGARERTVFKGYPKKKDEKAIAYYRHDAASLQWLLGENAWYAQITPTYHFTSDGSQEYPWSDDQLSGIKRRERAASVEGSLLMWAAYLRGDKPSLDGPGRDLRFGPLLTFEAEHGVDDTHWEGTRKDAPEAEAGEDMSAAVVDLDELSPVHAENDEKMDGLW